MKLSAYNDALELTKIILANNPMPIFANEKPADKQAECLALFIQTLAQKLDSLRSIAD